MDAAELLEWLNTILYAGARIDGEVVGEALTAELKGKALELARWPGEEEAEKRARAFQDAYEQAGPSQKVQSLLKDLPDQQTFRDELVSYLLDFDRQFDFEILGAEWGEKNSELRPELKRFFQRLRSGLILDSTWEPVLESFQEIQKDERAQQARQARSLPAEAAGLVRLLGKSIDIKLDVGSVASGANVSGVKIQIDRLIQMLVLQADPQALAEAGGQAGRAEARKEYLRQLYRDCQWLPLLEQETDSGQIFKVLLDDVYISLNTTERVKRDQEENGDQEDALPAGAGDRLYRGEDERPLSALEAAAKYEKLALLGDAGSGKSSFARHLLAWIAAAELGTRPAAPPGFPSGLLPVFLALRELAARLPLAELEPLSPHKQDQMLVQSVQTQIEADLQRPLTEHLHEKMCVVLREALRSGDCLLVLDGLDEVPQERRAWVRRAVSAMLEAHPLKRVLLTCRVRSYLGAAQQPGFTSVTLEGFDEEQVRSFAESWYNAQALRRRWPEKTWMDKADDLVKAALEQDENLRKLSSNPMLLTIMALVHQKNLRLPPEKVKLYQQAVEILLLRWQQIKGGSRLAEDEQLDQLLKDERRLRRIMERLAYEAHREQKGPDEEEADLPRWRAREVLEEKENIGDSSLALRFLDYVDQRAGLLVGKGGDPDKPTSYGFPHRTFQEYLAGCHLVGRLDAEEQIIQHASEGDVWSLAVELGAEELYYNGGPSGRKNVLAMVYGLLPAGALDAHQKRRQLLWAAKAAALLQERDLPVVANLRPGLLDVLATSVEHAGLPAVERAEAGRVLAALGETRHEVLRCDAMPFCYVPAGEFQMGEDKGAPSVSTGAYWIARWPVTNAQYREFVAAGGYRERTFWEEAARVERWHADGKVWRKLYSFTHDKWERVDEWAESFYDYGLPFNLDNHPVVGVCWYEALAFTRWLERRWREQGLLPPGGRVGLPSEAQWEKAARGGPRLPAKAVPGGPALGWQVDESALAWRENDTRRVYPWGEKFESDHANTAESGIRLTSAVGAFPGGRSPYGVEELSGSVGEWCASLHRDYPYRADDGRENPDDPALRVVRGGAWHYGGSGARCALRLSYPPVFRLDYQGFRVVVSLNH